MKFEPAGPDVGRADLVEVRDDIAAHWDELDDREKRVLHGRFWQDKPLHDLGKELHVSKERVRQIQNAAIAKLRGAA